MESAEHLRTGIAAALFAAVFLFGAPMHPVRRLIHDRRSLVSLGAGMSAAYVFVHVMPELHGTRTAVAESVQAARFEGMAAYFLALVGFLVFYALPHLGKRAREPHVATEAGRPEDGDSAGYRLHVGGFACYVCLMGYLLVHNLEETSASTLLFAVAIAFHLLSVDNSLRGEYGAVYERGGRYLLAAMAPLGWALGLGLALPPFVLALLVAFVSGAVIVNSAVMELTNETHGRLLPFLVGGVLYGLILLPLG